MGLNRAFSIALVKYGAGPEMSVTLRFTNVFDRSSGEWRCVASQVGR
jgi:ketosteroid isomerase-like protein